MWILLGPLYSDPIWIHGTFFGSHLNPMRFDHGCQGMQLVLWIGKWPSKMIFDVFHRVQDGFLTQAGPGSQHRFRSKPFPVHTLLKSEAHVITCQCHYMTCHVLAWHVNPQTKRSCGGANRFANNYQFQHTKHQLFAAWWHHGLAVFPLNRNFISTDSK